MIEYIGTPPVSRVIPVTKNTDRRLRFTRYDKAGEGRVEVPWEGTISVEIDIDPDTPEVIDADIDGADAVVIIDKAVANQVVTKKTKWRAILVQGAEYETPIAVGTFERHDG